MVADRSRFLSFTHIDKHPVSVTKETVLVLKVLVAYWYLLYIGVQYVGSVVLMCLGKVYVLLSNPYAQWLTITHVP